MSGFPVRKRRSDMAFSRLVTLLFIVVILGVSSGLYTQSNPIYLDPQQPIERRVEDLLSRMTLEEKVGQLNLPCVYVDQLGKTIPEKMQACRRFAAGTYTSEIGPGAGFFTLADTILQEGTQQQAEAAEQPVSRSETWTRAAEAPEAHAEQPIGTPAQGQPEVQGQQQVQGQSQGQGQPQVQGQPQTQGQPQVGGQPQGENFAQLQTGSDPKAIRAKAEAARAAAAAGDVAPVRNSTQAAATKTAEAARQDTGTRAAGQTASRNPQQTGPSK